VIDEKGQAVDGDQIMALIAAAWPRRASSAAAAWSRR
jgi:hypothetical protein